MKVDRGRPSIGVGEKEGGPFSSRLALALDKPVFFQGFNDASCGQRKQTRKIDGHTSSGDADHELLADLDLRGRLLGEGFPTLDHVLDHHVQGIFKAL